MRRRGRGLPTRMLRRLLLAALVLLLASIAGLYLFGRAGREEPQPAPPAVESRGRETLVLAGEGFEYEVSQGEERLFRIEAERILSEQEESYVLEGVVVRIERGQGLKYRVSGRTGTYHLASQLAVLDGEVQFEGPNGARLSGEGIELRRKGDLVVATSPVEFGFGERYVGRADRMRVDLERDRFVFAGAVRLETLPGDPTPMSLDCERIAFDRPEGMIRGEGGAVVRRGADVMRSRRFALALTQDEKAVRFISSRWNVAGSLDQGVTDGVASRLEFVADGVSVEFDEAGEEPRRVELEGRPEAPARLTEVDEGGLGRGVRAAELLALFEAGRLARIETGSEMELVESILPGGILPGAAPAGPSGPAHILRRVCAGAATVTFEPEGGMRRARLLGSVDLQEPGLHVSGEDLEAEVGKGTLVVMGEPARLRAEDGELEAPRLDYDRNEGRVRASGGVSTLLAGESDVALAISEEDRDAPVRVESEEAEWLTSRGEFSFLGGVRAWQGESFLLADRLEGETRRGRLQATGGVKTVWRRPARRAEAASEAAPQAIDVSAGRLDYQRQERTLVYSQSPRVHQGGRSLRSEEVTLRLTESGDVERVECRGKTRLEDPLSGNTVVGNEADYDPAVAQVRIRGEPAILRDRAGAEIRGRNLLYDLASGTARMLAEPRREAEAGSGQVPADGPAPGAGPPGPDPPAQSPPAEAPPA